MKTSAKQRIFGIIQIGKDQDHISTTFDFFISLVIFLNLFVTLFETFDQAEPYMGVLKAIELVTMVIFAL